MKIKIDGRTLDFNPVDDRDRESRFFMRLVRIQRLSLFRLRYRGWLECGHTVIMLGKPELAGGGLLCTRCRDAAKRTIFPE